MGRIKCSTCDRNRFSKNSSYCRFHHRLRNQTNIAKRRGYIAIDQSTITPEDFYNTNHCEICDKYLEDADKRIDHCHETGRFRGILCDIHNLMLGHAKDNPSTLYAAIKYLEWE